MLNLDNVWALLGVEMPKMCTFAFLVRGCLRTKTNYLCRILIIYLKLTFLETTMKYRIYALNC